jgi:alpha-glucosidase
MTWWRNAVVYQIYPRSFADGNGDGVGDIAGMRQRLPYVASLGVDAVWIGPWYPSPMHDGGYDVVDYRDIAPVFGTLDDARAFIDDAHRCGLRVLVDLVPNHTSWDHPWFREAIHSPPGHPARSRYMIRPGRGPDGDEPPTNWTAKFGGSTWTRLPDGQWYLHLFDASQPDLDWTNPEVQAEFLDIFRFWIQVGVDGFRVDVAHGLVKNPDLPDLAHTEGVLQNPLSEYHPYWDRDGIHDIVRQWRAVLDHEQQRHGRDLMMVAEACVLPTRLPLYLRPDEYHQSFNFPFLECPWDATAMYAVIDQAVVAARTHGYEPTWVLSNHDEMRPATRFGLPDGADWRTWLLEGPHQELNAALGLARARAATLMMLALPGSAYLYQGEELGLPEVYDLPMEVLDDPVWVDSGHTVKGRDGCRVPLPWTHHGQSFGFGGHPTWLPQPGWFGGCSVEAQADDPSSTLQLYQQALSLRRRHWATAGHFTWWAGVHNPDNGVVAFRRGDLGCVVNFWTQAVSRPTGTVILTSAPLPQDDLIPGSAAVWLDLPPDTGSYEFDSISRI